MQAGVRSVQFDSLPMPISAANISLRQLAAFQAVIERGGFGAAAGPLNMTQSAVSQAVQALERTLEGPLLLREREPNGRTRLVLTALGETTLAHARVVLGGVDAIVASARRQEAVGSGTLRVASIRSVAAQLLAPARVELARRHPRLVVDVWEGTDREVHQWLTAGTVDVGLVGPVLTTIPGARIVPLMEDPWFVALPAAHPLARRRRLELTELAGVPYVMADGGCEPAILSLFARAGTAPRVAHRAQSTDTILAMVAGGLGATLVPGLGLEAFESPAIHTVPLHPAASRVVAAVLPKGDAAPAGAELLLQVMQHQIARGERRRPRRSASPRGEPKRSSAGIGDWLGS